MSPHAVSNVTAEHLSRSACLYVRQAALPIADHAGSIHRQLDLRRRALALGWTDDQVITIDCDIGQSGSTTAGRVGYQQMLIDIARHRVGIVLALDASRLTRNASDWHDLLQLCAHHRTLIVLQDDADGPTDLLQNLPPMRQSPSNETISPAQVSMP